MPGYTDPDPGIIDRVRANLDTIIAEAQALLHLGESESAKRILEEARAARAALAPPTDSA